MDLSHHYMPGTQARDRRRHPRTRFDTEILVLDPHTARVQYVLVGADLSERGIRVEPHPGIQLGDQLEVAFFEAGEADPVRLCVEAVRDDGNLGWLLLFLEPDRPTQRRVQRLMRKLPAAASFGCPPDETPEGIAFGRIQTKPVQA
ncbi:MAG: PilZ domain-containing protein [Myxococcales bacterium]|nr:PilZ domain-containing protein [Myxococcales bacterium]MDH5305556.1 PilZ domain-containing protein [Myxococcales bacterium]MDH5565203.1 PilZ domain-containing protein [Myxococcales bacterium]